MAFIIARGQGWEIRQSRMTDAGPRSRTLACFKELGPKVIEQAIRRSDSDLSADELVRAARRAGAPVERDAASSAATTLLVELIAGRPPAPGLRRSLAAAFGDLDELTDAERSAAEWIGRDEAERGRALCDLLLLADSFPARSRSHASPFPRLVSGPA